MSAAFIYPEIIKELRDVCCKHLEGSATADEFQRVVQRGEATIVAVEEKDIRNFLTDIEGKIELVKFTVDTPDQLKASQKIASDLIQWLENRGNV
jgi:indole-3-glycerol phosphate synthase